MPISNDISVVIPVKNHVLKIRECIEGILRQTVLPAEIVVIDSGSTDGTLEILEEYEIVRVIKIAPDEFNHGATRNLGVAATKSTFVALTVQDAIPADEKWLERLLTGFTGEDIVGVCGCQAVKRSRDHNPLAWYRPLSVPRSSQVQFASATEFDSLTPEKKRAACGWDNVTAMYRRSALLATPFREVEFGEDSIWARDVLRQGLKLAYEPNAMVYHYHLELPDYEYKRTIEELYYSYREFGLRIPPRGIAFTVVRICKSLIRERSLSIVERMSWAIFNFRAAIARSRAVKQFYKACAAGPDSAKSFYARCCSSPAIPKKMTEGR